MKTLRTIRLPLLTHWGENFSITQAENPAEYQQYIPVAGGEGHISKFFIESEWKTFGVETLNQATAELENLKIESKKRFISFLNQSKGNNNLYNGRWYTKDGFIKK